MILVEIKAFAIHAPLDLKGVQDAITILIATTRIARHTRPPVVAQLQHVQVVVVHIVVGIEIGPRTLVIQDDRGCVIQVPV